jgi:hypothetical protein
MTIFLRLSFFMIVKVQTKELKLFFIIKNRPSHRDYFFLYVRAPDVKLGSPDLPQPAVERPQNLLTSRGRALYSLSITIMHT